MRLYNVKNIDRLFEVTKECKGNVKMILPDGEINLKTDKNNVQGLMKGIMPASGYDLLLQTERSDDTARLLKFAMRG